MQFIRLFQVKRRFILHIYTNYNEITDLMLQCQMKIQVFLGYATTASPGLRQFLRGKTALIRNFIFHSKFGNCTLWQNRRDVMIYLLH